MDKIREITSLNHLQKLYDSETDEFNEKTVFGKVVSHKNVILFVNDGDGKTIAIFKPELVIPKNEGLNWVMDNQSVLFLFKKGTVVLRQIKMNEPNPIYFSSDDFLMKLFWYLKLVQSQNGMTVSPNYCFCDTNIFPSLHVNRLSIYKFY